MILHGDCLERLKELEENSVDSVVTDPPYGLKFMGKKWDYDVPSIAVWTEIARVLKPGGHVLSFGGTRTYHRMVCVIEDAGLEIRDQLQWLYGSGFPKSHDISKGIDKQLGAKREVIGERISPYTSTARNETESMGKHSVKVGEDGYERHAITAPATPEAYRYKGWGTALKPANEPIVLARKPLEKGLTVAENMLKWGVGGLNIDESRIASENNEHFRALVKKAPDSQKVTYEGQAYKNEFQPTNSAQGRWPANLLLDETAAAMLDEQSGTLKSGAGNKNKSNKDNGKTLGSGLGKGIGDGIGGDSGGASRFFYVAKASKRERGIGNSHPTVKPLKLMEYLCKLITPPGGTILDPFCGSGSTGVAAFKNGFKFIGIEMNEEYCEIARRRIDSSRSS